MRGYLFQQAALHDFDVHVLVVPIAGHSGPVPAPGDHGDRPGAGRLTVTVLPRWPAQELRAQLPVLLAQPAWRSRFTVASPLPHAARQAPATLAAAVATAAAAAPGSPVHVARSYLAPLGIALAERLSSPWATLDLDDDDEQLAGVLGGPGEPAAYRRLIAVFGPLFRGVALAAPAEAAAISDRHGLATTVIPNAVDFAAAAPPSTSTSRTGGPVETGDAGEVSGRDGAGVRVLFVGNLSYRPNRDAACVLVREVLPRLRQLISGPVTVTLVGPTGVDDALAPLGRQPGVRVLGFVPDLAACYRSADVVAAPLPPGGGTRIKLLEAMAHGVPVVTTTAGATGLSACHGTHLLIADSPAAAAAAVARLAADPALGGRLAASAAELVRERYSHAAVTPLIRDFLTAPAPAPALSAGPALGPALAQPGPAPC
jgi:glycosyltransferase involved in cell wall biosynthesis